MTDAETGVLDDQTGTLWRDPNWLSCFPLNEFSALDYFALSPFYDTNCNNEELRRRGQGLERLGAMPPGLEYRLQDCLPPHLFVIRKVLRRGPQAESDLAFYYILDGSVYQAPSIFAAISAKVKRCLHNLNAGFVKMQRDIDPLQKVIHKPDAALQDSAKVAALLQLPKDPLSREHVVNVDNIILTVLQKDHKRKTHTASMPSSSLQPGGQQSSEPSMLQ